MSSTSPSVINNASINELNGVLNTGMMFESVVVVVEADNDALVVVVGEEVPDIRDDDDDKLKMATLCSFDEDDDIFLKAMKM